MKISNYIMSKGYFKRAVAVYAITDKCVCVPLNNIRFDDDGGCASKIMATTTTTTNILVCFCFIFHILMDMSKCHPP